MNLLADTIVETKQTPACWDHTAVFSDPSLYYDAKDEEFAGLSDDQHAELARQRAAAEDAAVNVCMGCPLLFACEEKALEAAAEGVQIAGVVGGRTEAERSALVRARTGKAPARSSAPTSANPQIAPGDRGPRNQVDDEQVRIMTLQGRNAAYIARELGCNERTVVRARKRLKDTTDTPAAQPTPKQAAKVTATVPDRVAAAKRLMVEEMARDIAASAQPRQSTHPRTSRGTNAPRRATGVTCPQPSAAATGRAVNIAQVTEPMRVIYDILADGDWHSRTELVTAALSAVSEADALAWWTRKNSVNVDGAKVLNPRKAATPVAERIRAGAWDKVYNMLSASQRKGKTTERGGEDNDQYRFTSAALASWLPTVAPRIGAVA